MNRAGLADEPAPEPREHPGGRHQREPESAHLIAVIRSVIAVGPDKSGQELLRVETDELSRTTLVSTDRICNPAVSPDSSRIVYGTGEDCSRLHLISSRGGQPVDITPPARPGDASFAAGALTSWAILVAGA